MGVSGDVAMLPSRVSFSLVFMLRDAFRNVELVLLAGRN